MAVCRESGQINVPNRLVTALLHKNSNNIGVYQNSSQVLMFTNKGEQPLNWTLALAPGSAPLAGSFSPSEGVLEACDLEEVEFVFDPTRLSARGTPYTLVYTLASSSLTDDQISITASVSVSADMDTRKSNVTLADTTTVYAGGSRGSMMFKVIPVDATGAEIQDASQLVYSAMLTHQASQESLSCSLKYDPGYKQTEGTCNIPESVCNGSDYDECSPPIGQFILAVRDTGGELVGGTGYAFVVEDCPEKYYYSEDSQNCKWCLEEMECNDPGVTIRTVSLKPGYWRADEESDDIRPCRFHDVSCPGVNQTTGPNPYCAPNYRGPLCSACAADFFSNWDGDGRCIQCASGASHLPTIWLVSGIVGFVLLCTACAYKKKDKMMENMKENEKVEKKSSFLANADQVYSLAKFKLFTLFLTAQVISEFATISSGTGDEAYPEPAATFVRALGVTRLDAFGFVPLGCVVSSNFYHRVLLKVCFPPVAIAVLWLLNALMSSKTFAMTAKRLTLLLLEVTLPSTMTSLIMVFVCDSFYDGAFLRADLMLSCDGSNRHRVQWVVFALISLTVYSLGGAPILAFSLS